VALFADVSGMTQRERTVRGSERRLERTCMEFVFKRDLCRKLSCLAATESNGVCGTRRWKVEALEATL
jgi:hypothetical protein